MPSLHKVSSVGTELGALGCQFQSHGCLSPSILQYLDKWLLSLWQLCCVDKCRIKTLVPSRHPHCLLRDTECLPKDCGLQRDLPTLTLVKLILSFFFFFSLREFLHPFLCKQKAFGPRCTKTTIIISISKVLCSLLSMSHMSATLALPSVKWMGQELLELVFTCCCC